jgi:hypothetical protein
LSPAAAATGGAAAVSRGGRDERDEVRGFDPGGGEPGPHRRDHGFGLRRRAGHRQHDPVARHDVGSERRAGGRRVEGGGHDPPGGRSPLPAGAAAIGAERVLGHLEDERIVGAVVERDAVHAAGSPGEPRSSYRHSAVTARVGRRIGLVAPGGSAA